MARVKRLNRKTKNNAEKKESLMPQDDSIHSVEAHKYITTFYYYVNFTTERVLLFNNIFVGYVML